MSTTAKTAARSETGMVDLSRHTPQMLNMVTARMNERLAQELRSIGLPLAHWRILAILRWHGTCTLKDIHALTVIDTSTASRAVKRLEEQHALTRRWDGDDARARQISITAEGEALFERAWTIVSGFHNHIFRDLDASEKEMLTDLLERIEVRLGKSVWQD